MPELPEVETVARAVAPHLVGRSIAAWCQGDKPLRLPLPTADERRDVVGRRILEVWRRAKLLVIELAGRRAVIVHLGMTGTLSVAAKRSRRAKHEHVVLTLSDGAVLRFRDPRRFGLVRVVRLPAPRTLPPSFAAGLGPEPLGRGFSTTCFAAACAASARAIKSVIMDNAVVVGVGNIYAAESLFRARIHPLTPARDLKRPQVVALRREIVAVLQEAIVAGGTTISDFRTVDGSEGHFSRHLAVYDRAGEPCERCHTGLIERVVISGRSSYFCPTCQPAPRKKRGQTPLRPHR